MRLETAGIIALLDGYNAGWWNNQPKKELDNARTIYSNWC